MGSGGIAPPFLTSALDGSKGSASRTVRLTLGEEIPVPSGQEAGCSLVPAWMLWRTEKSCPAVIQTRAIPPVARRYTDWAIPAT
jgi:hypothetical protein